MENPQLPHFDHEKNKRYKFKDACSTFFGLGFDYLNIFLNEIGKLFCEIPGEGFTFPILSLLVIKTICSKSKFIVICCFGGKPIVETQECSDIIIRLFHDRPGRSVSIDFVLLILKNNSCYCYCFPYLLTLRRKPGTAKRQCSFPKWSKCLQCDTQPLYEVTHTMQHLLKR